MDAALAIFWICFCVLALGISMVALRALRMIKSFIEQWRLW